MSREFQNIWTVNSADACVCKLKNPKLLSILEMSPIYSKVVRQAMHNNWRLGPWEQDKGFIPSMTRALIRAGDKTAKGPNDL